MPNPFVLTVGQLKQRLAKVPDDTAVVLFDKETSVGYKTPIYPTLMDPRVDLALNRFKNLYGSAEFVCREVLPKNSRAKVIKAFLIA